MIIEWLRSFTSPLMESILAGKISLRLPKDEYCSGNIKEQCRLKDASGAYFIKTIYVYSLNDCNLYCCDK